MTADDASAAPEERASDRRRLEATASRLRAAFPDYPMRYVYVLVSVGAVDAADRTVLATVFEDVKHQFGVSDAQLGLLTAAYSVVAALSVIPFGWLADRTNRVRLIALGFIPWSIAMLMTGAATSFAMMFAARLFLGTIEATNGPSTPSLLGDYYPVRRRSRVMAMFSVGTTIGSVVGLVVGGVLASFVGWRPTFFVFGAFGFMCAGVVVASLREPRRGLPDAIEQVNTALAALDAPAIDSGDQTRATEKPVRKSGDLDYRKLTVKQATREILKVRTMWIVFFASAIGDFFMSGVSTWSVTYFRRYYHLGAAPAGALAATIAISVITGAVISSRAGDRMVDGGAPAQRVVISAGANVATFCAALVAYSVNNLSLGLLAFLLVGFSIGVSQPLLAAVSLDTLVSYLRGRANSLRSLMRIGGTALAPILFGFLSDKYSLRAAFLGTAPFLLVSGLILFLAARTCVPDMEFAQAESMRQHELEDDTPDDSSSGVLLPEGLQ